MALKPRVRSPSRVESDFAQGCTSSEMVYRHLDIHYLEIYKNTIDKIVFSSYFVFE